MGTIFEQARAAVSSAVIESLLATDGAYWENGEYWTRNPTRSDREIGSFSISDAGLWHDFSDDTSGDLITLLVAIRGCSKKEAAEEIVKVSGGVVRDDRPAQATKKRDKIAPQIPAPEAALKSLNPNLTAAWCVEKHGLPVKGWTYRTAEGGVCFCVSRHEKRKPDGSIDKDVLPWYYGVDDRWHTGQAMDSGRPLYKLDQIVKADGSTQILIVEGEKCASIDVPGYLVTTWAGGASATSKTDWAPLEQAAKEGRVIIWPDADEAGAKAAAAIVRRLPGTRILRIEVRSEGWDLADAVAEGVDPVAFIVGALPPESMPDRVDDGLPFVVLGNDRGFHYFMRRDSRVIFPVSRGNFSAIKALEIAPLSWWAVDFSSKEDGIRALDIYDFLTHKSNAVGQYDRSKIRGAGVWRDHDGIVLNDGQRLILPDGTALSYDDHKSEYIYVKSSSRFGTMTGPESTDEDGRTLEALFAAQQWAEPAMAPLAMGWALIAPFGGMLKWRPHIWVTGRAGTGKSEFMESVIQRICGPFSFVGAAKTTEAGIRRDLDVDARPAILDEMEPKNAKTRDKIASLLELARNSSSDGPANIITMANANGGVETFIIRSCFAFSSVYVPDEDAATTSRIIRMEMKLQTTQEEKFRISDALKAECMQDPTRYSRRMYRALSRILTDIEWIRSAYLGRFGEQRKIDQFAPLMAASWAAQSRECLKDSSDGQRWLQEWLLKLMDKSGESQDDEDAVMRHLLGAQVRTDDMRTRTVAELMTTASSTEEDGGDAHLLSRNGMRVMWSGTQRVLAISIDNQYVRRILAGTAYEAGYAAPMRRNKFCVSDSRVVRFASGQSRAVLLDWEGFREQYIGGPAEVVKPVEKDKQEDIPF